MVNQEVRPDGDTMKAIQAKVDAQQKLQQMQIELEQSKIAADKAKVDAQGVADAEVIKAQGTATANEKIQASLSPELVQYTIAKAWDGHLPQVSGSGGTMISLPLPDKTKQ
jgi:regulator of protease activity HflC (stomatin/prohibitin superfamily)